MPPSFLQMRAVQLSLEQIQADGDLETGLGLGILARFRRTASTATPHALQDAGQTDGGAIFDQHRCELLRTSAARPRWRTPPSRWHGARAKASSRRCARSNGSPGLACTASIPGSQQSAQARWGQQQAASTIPRPIHRPGFVKVIVRCRKPYCLPSSTASCSNKVRRRRLTRAILVMIGLL